MKFSYIFSFLCVGCFFSVKSAENELIKKHYVDLGTLGQDSTFHTIKKGDTITVTEINQNKEGFFARLYNYDVTRHQESKSIKVVDLQNAQPAAEVQNAQIQDESIDVFSVQCKNSNGKPLAAYKRLVPTIKDNPHAPRATAFLRQLLVQQPKLIGRLPANRNCEEKLNGIFPDVPALEVTTSENTIQYRPLRRDLAIFAPLYLKDGDVLPGQRVWVKKTVYNSEKQKTGETSAVNHLLYTRGPGIEKEWHQITVEQSLVAQDERMHHHVANYEKKQTVEKPWARPSLLGAGIIVSAIAGATWCINKFARD